MILLGLLWACVPKGQAEAGQPDAVGDEPPTIAEVTWGCEVDSATWTFVVDTVHWSGGAWLWMASDPDTVERHAVYSQSAAGDGSADQLGVELDVVSDWRDAVAGSSTRFACADQDELAYQVTIYDRQGDVATDCRRWGAEGVLETVDSASPCELRLEGEDTGR
ncbi:hypothetical protein L6R53_14305 [Myxococcota bacterium]|nr:hypothetical protein [Myxococcota bacterium]